MANGVSDVEVADLVNKLVRSGVDRKYGSSGTRKSGSEFEQLQDLIQQSFVQNEDLAYAVTGLAAQDLLDVLDRAIASLALQSDLALDCLARPSPVEHIEDLANARSAIGALDGAAQVRTSDQNITESPAWSRFTQSTQRFLDEAAQRIVRSGEIRHTPDEARALIAPELLRYMDTHDDLVRRAQLLRDSMDAYRALALPGRANQDLLGQARTSMESLYIAMETETPVGRLSLLRDAALQVVSVRASLASLVQRTSTANYCDLTGVAAREASAQYAPTRAHLTSPSVSPHNTLEREDLNVLVDGATTLNLRLLGASAPTLRGNTREPFVVADTDVPPTVYANHQVAIRVDSTLYGAFLTVGSRSAAEVALDITPALAGSGFLVRPYVASTLRLGAFAVMTVLSLSIANFTDPQGAWPAMQVDDWVNVTAGAPSVLGWWRVIDVAGVPLQFTAAKEAVVDPIVDGGVTLDMNRGGRGLEIVAENARAALEANRTLSVPTSSDIQVRAAALLGWPANVTVQGQRVSAGLLAQQLNQSASITGGGTDPRVLASVEDTPIVTCEARTNPASSTTVVLTRGTWPALLIGPSMAFTAPLPPAIEVGDCAVLRSSSRVGAWGFVATISPNRMLCTVASTSEPWPIESAMVEFGPVVDMPAGKVVVVQGPAVNQGRYTAQGVDGVLTGTPKAPLAMQLTRPFPVYQGAGAQPARLGPVSVVAEHLSLTSQLDATTGALVIQAGTSDLFASGTTAHASTRFVRVGAVRQGPAPQVGDRVEFRDSATLEPSQELSVVAVHEGGAVLELDATTMSPGPWNLNGTAPSLRVRRGPHAAYLTLQQELRGWLVTDDGAARARELRRLLNPVLVNQNARAQDVQDLVRALQGAQQSLEQLRVSVVAYQVAPSQELDDILVALREQGANRAIQLLRECRFPEFFAVTPDGSSYSGAVQGAVQAVSGSLPVRATQPRQTQDLLAQYEEPDANHTFEELRPDPVQPGEEYEFGL